MLPIQIKSRKDYDYCVNSGFEPLLDRRFEIDHNLRVEIQKDLFGEGNSEKQNVKFYKWVWAHKPHWCEECMKPLPEYSATYVSHIISRGSDARMAYDARNVNILCFKHHSLWENGDRETMRINEINKLTIEQLKNEYK